MKILAKLLLIFILVAVILPSLFMWRIVVFAEQDQARPADAAIVLGAGVFRGRPSPILRARIDRSALNDIRSIDGAVAVMAASESGVNRLESS